MMRCLSTLAIIFSCWSMPVACPRAAAAVLEWVRQLGTDGWDDSNGVSVDRMGNVFIAGHTWGSLGGLNAGGRDDAYVAKYDAAGTLAWVQQIGSKGEDWAMAVSADGLGNAYVAGYTSGNLGASSASGYDAFLVKYDALGARQWTRQLSSSTYDHGYGVSADGKGSVYITGNTAGNLGGPDTQNGGAFIAKFDDAGNRLWTRQLGADGDSANGVSTDGHGNVYITGVTYRNLGGPLVGFYDAFVAKFDADGSHLWTRQQSSGDVGWSVVADDLGNVFTSAQTGGGVAIAAKYDGEGNRQWIQNLGGSIAVNRLSASPDGLGNLYMTIGGIVTKLDGNGARLWTIPLIGADARSVATDGIGNVYVSGWTNQSFGGQFAGGEFDAFVTKIADDIIGDFSGDRVIDGHDFLLWQRTVASTTNLAADGNGNNIVDAADLLVWKEHFGQSAALRKAGAFQASIPEPSTLTVAALAFASLCRRNRRLTRRPSRRRVALNPRHAIEVGVVAGQVRQAVMLHDGSQQGIVGHKPCLLADRRSHIGKGFVYRKNPTRARDRGAERNNARDWRSRLFGTIADMARTLGYHVVISGYGLWLPGDQRGHWSEAWDERLGDQITKAIHRTTFHRGPVWSKGRWRPFIYEP